MRNTGLMILLVLLLVQRTTAQGREEFNGPYAGWADVKNRFGAKGNGKDDDTKALQLALDSLSCPPKGLNMGPRAYMVVYLPAGTYCISSTLLLRGKIGVSIIGEDPARTTIKWIGRDKDTIFWSNGSAYFKVSRLTWDANKRTGMEAIGVHWKDRWDDAKSKSFATLNIELSDNIFIGGFKFGISGGTYNGAGTSYNDSEIAIRRCVFQGCTESGIEIGGYNALDYWIWDCRFIECASGVHCSYGGYHLYRCFFSGSKVADLHNTHGYYNSVRGCYSENSRMFSADETVGSNPFKRIFQDNTVINPLVLPIVYYHLGKISLMGNKFTRASDTSVKNVLYMTSWAPGVYEALSLNNTYGYKNPVEMTVPVKKLYSFGDKQAIVKPDAAQFLKTLEATPPKVRRKVLEVPTSAGSDVIQEIINQAARLKGQRPVVHFGMGTYILDKPLVVPAGADMQLAGDGLLYASVILQKEGGLSGKAIILVKGPSYIEIRDLQIGKDGDNHQLPAILFEGIDQPGAQAHLDQIYSHADTSLSVESMNYLYVQKENSFFMDGNYIAGGPLLRNGKGTARVCCYGGQFARLSVQQNGRFVAKDCWWEGESRLPLDLQGSGTVCIDGAMIAPNRADSSPVIRIGRFDGHISLMNMYVQGALAPQADNPNLSLLVWNINFYHKMDALYFLRKGANYKGAFLGLTTQCFNASNPGCKNVATIGDQLQNVQDANAFLNAETAIDQASEPLSFGNLMPGISNIRISRVSIVGSRGKGVSFTSN